MATKKNPTRKKDGRYKGETPEATEAFSMYVKMGADRSLAAVAESMECNISMVERWSKQFGWRDRILKMQEEEAARAKEQIKEQYFADAEKLRDFKYTILDTLKEKFDTAHRCGACKQHRLSVGDMIDILHVVKTELNEPTSITKNTMPNPGNDPFAVIISRLFPAESDDGSAKTAK